MFVSAFAGLRPLVRRSSGGSSESEISRRARDLLDSDGPHLGRGREVHDHRAMAKRSWIWSRPE